MDQTVDPDCGERCPFRARNLFFRDRVGISEWRCFLLNWNHLQWQMGKYKK